MSDPIAELPPLDDLKERLEDPYWVKYYKKVNIYKGPSESLSYLLKVLRKNSNNPLSYRE